MEIGHMDSNAAFCINRLTIVHPFFEEIHKTACTWLSITIVQKTMCRFLQKRMQRLRYITKNHNKVEQTAQEHKDMKQLVKTKAWCNIRLFHQIDDRT